MSEEVVAAAASGDVVVDVPGDASAVPGEIGDDSCFNVHLDEKTYRQVMRGNWLELGDYVGEIKKADLVPPIKSKGGDDKGKIGGARLTLKVISAPTSVPVPPGGFSDVRRDFRIWPHPTEGQMKATEIDKQDLYRLIDASGFKPTGPFNPYEVFKSLVGKKVIFAAMKDQDVNGNESRKMGNFRPYQVLGAGEVAVTT